MTITDRTRKLLWAHSGNKCALCGRPLVYAATSKDPAVIIGDECHIVSGAEGGPRYDPFFLGDHDGYDNLLLLCAADHRRVDTQLGTYSVEKLKQLKAYHEEAFANAMDARFVRLEEPTAPPVGFDNYRTEILFVPGQPEPDLERFQQALIRDQRLRSYGKVGTGFSGPSATRRLAWVQSFLPVSRELINAFARETGVEVAGVRSERLPGVYRGLIPE